MEGLKLIHDGGKSNIYLDESDVNQTLVIKILKNTHPTSKQLFHLQNEFQLTSNLSIGGVRKALKEGRIEDRPAIYFEYIDGKTLKEGYVKNRQGLSEMLDIAVKITKVLANIHQNGILHKDLTSNNILIHDAGNGPEAQIIDFAFASRIDDAVMMVSPEQLEGTLAYISPEQTGRTNRKLDFRSDLYSLGVTFYEMFSGRLPFQVEDSMEMVHAHLALTPEPPSKWNPKLPKVIDGIILRLLAKSAEDRYPSASALVSDLRRCKKEWKVSGKIAPFELSLKGSEGKFELPGEIFEREDELVHLTKAYERATYGMVEMVVIKGPPGIGKSSLVDTFGLTVQQQNGKFAKGHFEELKGSVPYQATDMALNDFVGQLLTKSVGHLEQWKRKILEATGENSALLTQTIPKLELIIGQQQKLPEVGAAEAQNRLTHTFLNFVKALSHQESPLVLFLDDCQWIDSDSLTLLELLVNDPENKFLMIVAAVRESPGEKENRFLDWVDSLEEHKRSPGVIEVQPLSELAISEMISCSLKHPVGELHELAGTIFEKTQGNPFFVRQFLKSLHEGGLLIYKKGNWNFDIGAVRQLNITDNVAELMAGRIKKLPKQTQEVLKVAACIGNKFDISTLQPLIEGQEPHYLISNLNRAIQEGLIADLTDDKHPADLTYRFTHERIRKAAYSMIAKNQPRDIHLKIGRILTEKYAKTDIEELDSDQIFALIYQWNIGRRLLIDKEEKKYLANLNLVAAKRSNAGAAYRAAIKYAQIGMDLLAVYGWENNYRLNHNLISESIEAAYLEGNYGMLDTLTERCIQNSVNLSDKVTAYEIRIQTYISQHKHAAAIETGLKVLKQLGIIFPSSPTRSNIFWGFTRINRMLRKRTFDQLLELPAMTDPQKLAAMRIISVITTPANFHKPRLGALLVIKQIQLCIRDGNSAYSPDTFVGYGVGLAQNKNEYEKGFKYGELALKLLERYDAEEYRAKTYVGFFRLLAPFKYHYRDTLKPLLLGYESGLKSGDITSAGYCLIQVIFTHFLIGTPYPTILEKIALYQPELNRIKHLPALDHLEIMASTANNLIQPQEEPYILKGMYAGELPLEERLLESENQTILYSLFANKMTLAYWFGEKEIAFEYAKRLDVISEGHHEPTNGLVFGYNALVTLDYLSDRPHSEQRELLKKVDQYLNQMGVLAKHAPMNFEPLYLIILAEKNRVLGMEKEARDFFEKAIQSAKDYEYPVYEAISLELTGKFYRQIGNHFLAEAYLVRAWQAYKALGASAKVLFLEERYPHFIGKSLKSGGSSSSSTKTHSSGSTLSSLDLETITKATNTLSAEVVLSNLVDKMMRIVLENAGAERGVFIGNQDNNLMVLADGDLKKGTGILEPNYLESHQDLPQTVIYYAARTLDPILLEDGIIDPQFQNDPYIQQRRVKSVICYPIIYKSQLSGVIYLENNLTTGAFTQRHLEILHLLSTQVAISIENARLYESLDEKVRERTAELNQKNQALGKALSQLKSAQSHLVQNEKMASLGQLTAGIAHEINNPINFVTGNIGPLTRDIEDIKELLLKIKELENTTDLKAGIAKVKEFREEIDAEFIFEEIEILLSGIKEGALRTKDIVLGLKNFSRLDEQDFKIADIHEGIDSTLTLLNSQLKNRIEVVKEYDPTLPRIECLPGRLNQVFMNLFTNGIQAINDHVADSPDSPAQITIKTFQQEGSILISVKDTGKGMSQEIQQHIFEPFYTTKDVGEGTGLGLSITYGIIQQHNGKIEVNSAPGEGSEFVITLPNTRKKE